jgi:hypothetical protein
VTKYSDTIAVATYNLSEQFPQCIHIPINEPYRCSISISNRAVDVGATSMERTRLVGDITGSTPNGERRGRPSVIIGQPQVQPIGLTFSFTFATTLSSLGTNQSIESANCEIEGYNE